MQITSSSPQPPTSSTLFPYTTLFRSRTYLAPGRNGASGRTCPPRCSRSRGVPARRKVSKIGAELVADSPERRQANLVAYLREDRKSTRLNSSHTVISYAVFCLKKKTL